MREYFIRWRLFFYDHKQDAFLAVLAVIMCFIGTIIVGVIYGLDATPQPVIQPQVPRTTPTPKPRPDKKIIVVDVSGAVIHAGTYELAEGARLSDALKHAGGMNRDAALDYVNRNYNFARILTDQEKVYVPSKSEIDDGTFVEATFYIESQSIVPTQKQTNANAQSAISINSASKEELDALSGVGPATAEKIIQNRPYSSMDELIRKSGLSETVVHKFASEIRYE